MSRGVTGGLLGEGEAMSSKDTAGKVKESSFSLRSVASQPSPLVARTGFLA